MNLLKRRKVTLCQQSEFKMCMFELDFMTVHPIWRTFMVQFATYISEVWELGASCLNNAQWWKEYLGKIIIQNI